MSVNQTDKKYTIKYKKIQYKTGKYTGKNVNLTELYRALEKTGIIIYLVKKCLSREKFFTIKIIIDNLT